MSNAWGRGGVVVHHDEYLKLGENVEDRLIAYRKIFQYPISPNDVHMIKDAARYNRPVGDNRFCEQVAERYGIQFPMRGRGRPRVKVMSE